MLAIDGSTGRARGRKSSALGGRTTRFPAKVAVRRVAEEWVLAIGAAGLRRRKRWAAALGMVLAVPEVASESECIRRRVRPDGHSTLEPTIRGEDDDVLADGTLARWYES